MADKNRTIAVFGGTFNPVHFGHLDIAQSAKTELGYDLIVIVPALIPVHKNPDTTTSATDRLAMLRLAVAGMDHVAIDECEILRGGPSYTIDTVAHIYREYRFTGKPGLIIGDDLIDGFGAWKCVEKFVAEVDLVVARRMCAHKRVFPREHRYLRNELNSSASRDIRRFVREGVDIRQYVPLPVASYIESHGIYKRKVD